MSQSAYHWEARRKQRIIDRRQVALARLQEAQAQEEARLAELAAKEERERREQEEARRKELEQHLRTRNKGDMKKSVHNRERLEGVHFYQQGHRTRKIKL
ncbi:coiled-coil domain-containing protein 200-like isoform X3 [Ptychodera flava]|uniref:coiled-coil domain-containing protein 200-like isoform X3 n=1 Tax=Ptychodera flava TaxID=63121 RepID=UPI00396A7B55